jgi:Domain of unknown function (DUF3498)
LQYEKEIVELRNAMESLQSRLSRAEQLYLQGAMQAALAVKEKELDEKRREMLDSRSSMTTSSSSTRYTPSPVECHPLDDSVKDDQLKTMISRLMSLEEELQREKRKMADKQKVIEAQVQTIQALDAANNRLLSALAQLRHETPVCDTTTDCDDMDQQNSLTGMCGLGAGPTGEADFGSASLSLARRILADLGEVQSSSC